MRIRTFFGRLLVAGATATAVFALAAATGIFPTTVAQRHAPERRHRGHHGPDSAEMRKTVEILRKEGFSEPYSLERDQATSRSSDARASIGLNCSRPGS